LKKNVQNQAPPFKGFMVTAPFLFANLDRFPNRNGNWKFVFCFRKKQVTVQALRHQGGAAGAAE
jgi:hypothetical protein